MAADSGDLARMRLGVLHALGIAFANAAESGTDTGIAAVLSGNFPADAPPLPFPCSRETHGYIEAVYMLREETSLHDDEVEGISCAVTQRTLTALEGNDMAFAGCGEFVEAAIAAVDRMTSVTDTRELRAVLQNARYSAKR